MLSYIPGWKNYIRINLGRSVGTVNTYERAIRQFHGWLADNQYDTDPNALTAAEIKEFMRALVFRYQNLKNSSRAQKLSAIKSFFAYLISGIAAVSQTAPLRRFDYSCVQSQLDMHPDSWLLSFMQRYDPSSKNVHSPGSN